MIKEISVSISRTFNLGNFESLRLEASAGGSVDDDTTADEVREMLLSECRTSLRAAYEAHHPKRNP